jgi:hypothetical protein
VAGLSRPERRPDVAHSGWFSTFTNIKAAGNSISSQLGGQLLPGQPVRYGKDRRYHREVMGLLEYQTMPSLRDVTQDGSSQLGTAAPVRATDTVRKRQAVQPVHHIQNHTCRVTSSQPGGPLCWASPLAFGLIDVDLQLTVVYSL